MEDNKYNKQNKLFDYEFKTYKVGSSINITDNEKKVFEIINMTLEKNNLKEVVCRVVGGWVRDKVNIIYLTNNKFIL